MRAQLTKEKLGDKCCTICKMLSDKDPVYRGMTNSCALSKLRRVYRYLLYLPFQVCSIKLGPYCLNPEGLVSFYYVLSTLA